MSYKQLFSICIILFLVILTFVSCKKDNGASFFNRKRKNTSSEPYYYLKNRKNAVINKAGKVCLHLDQKDSIFITPDKITQLHVEEDPSDSEFPIEVYQFTNLKKLWLGDRNFTRIPMGISSLQKLELFDCQHSKVTTVSEDIGELKNLKTLSFLFTELDSLPNSIGNLSNLEVLNLGGTPIDTLPDSIKQLTNLKKLVLVKKAEKDRFSKAVLEDLELALPECEILWQ